MENAGALTEVEPKNRRWDGECYRENLTRMREGGCGFLTTCCFFSPPATLRQHHQPLRLCNLRVPWYNELL
ncbi:Hypothetical predicted protein [Cloeon dipterum]|uniref:Uncharacterized protein n=1 Tax=Cloeon dipterum TaxID=197152 RepID=A0A8S1BTB5_9INSE|nr:Hypothetical predicted protein [Cloeon dipterum]